MWQWHPSRHRGRETFSPLVRSTLTAALIRLVLAPDRSRGWVRPLGQICDLEAPCANRCLQHLQLFLRLARF